MTNWGQVKKKGFLGQRNHLISRNKKKQLFWTTTGVNRRECSGTKSIKRYGENGEIKQERSVRKHDEDALHEKEIHIMHDESVYLWL